MNHKMILICTSVMTASSVQAQSVDPDQSYSWAENIGYFNFSGAGDPSGSQEVFAHDEYLEGYIWSENTGWVNLGIGDGPYANTTGLNFGVNRDPVSGNLTGYGWNENIGWINFSGGSMATPANPARIEDSRFKGFAWSENAGWVNLDDNTVYVGLLSCPADLNADGSLNFLDVSAFLSAYGNMDSAADFNEDGVFNFLDVSAFLSAFGNGCSPV